MDINNINNNLNNFSDFKISDNKIKNKVPGTHINADQNILENTLEPKDNITIIPESNFQNELNNNEIQNKDNKNLHTLDRKETVDKRDSQTIPKNLTLFEIENEPNFVNKTPKNNVIKTFGPTNFPNNPEEMFINPKYL